MGLTSDLGVAGSYLKGEQFEGGLTVKILKDPELIKANEGFGFKADGPHAGKAVRFYFEVNGEEKTFDASSKRMIAAMDDFKVGDIVTITRSGSAMKTEWEAKAF